VEVDIRESIKSLIAQFDPKPDFINNPKFAVRIVLDVIDELYPDADLTKSGCKQKQTVIEKLKYVIPQISTVERFIKSQK
jgi:hypothetical protein